MKRITFLPKYKSLIKKHEKNTTIRLGADMFTKLKDEMGKVVNLTVRNRKIAQGYVIELRLTPISSLTTHDFEGESPDCRSHGKVIKTLSKIYRKKVKDTNYVTVIKWVYYPIKHETKKIVVGGIY